MCLIIDRPTGRVVPTEYLTTGLFSNPDGWGIMWAARGEIVALRGLPPSEFWDAWKEAPPDRDVAVHFRWATHGTKALDNVHPFIYKDAVAVMHNGIIDIDRSADPRLSDTAHYVERVVGPWVTRNPTALQYAELLAPDIAGSRLLLLDRLGVRARVNEARWTLRNGVWYSNADNFSERSLRYWPITARVERGRQADSDSWDREDEWDREGMTRAYRAKTVSVLGYLRRLRWRSGTKAARDVAESLIGSRKAHVAEAAWEFIDDLDRAAHPGTHDVRPGTHDDR